MVDDIDFDIIYDDLYNENENKLKNSSDRILITSSLFNENKVESTINSGEKERYSDIFNENIVKPIIQRMFPDVEFDYKNGISRLEYNLGNYDWYDRFESRLMLKKIYDNRYGIVSYVSTLKLYYDGTNYSYSPNFFGLYGTFKLKENIKGKIYITNNRGVKKDVKVNMDVAEFEKYFDVSADDQIEAFRLLTSDVMNKLVEIRKSIKKEIEIKVMNDNVFFRIFMPPIFLSNQFSKKLEKENIRKSIKLLNEIINLFDILDELKI